VDKQGAAVDTQIRLGSHFTQLSGGYETSAPFFYGHTDAHGDFELDGIPQGGPYVLEFQRGGGWTTLIDSSGGAAQPVSVTPLAPVDLGFVVVPPA
jgi:hypothetical protein